MVQQDKGLEPISQTLKQYSNPGSTPAPRTSIDEDEETEEGKKEALRKRLNLTSWDNTFANFKALKGTVEALSAFKELASGEATWHMLLCYGGAGSGKSHLCEALSIALAERNIVAPVTEWPTFIRYLKNTMHDEWKGKYDEVFRNYSRAPWLMLDDVGMGGIGSNWEWGEFDEIINYRYRNNLPTVVTTNLDISKLPDRAVSRFRDALKGRCVLNDGKDYRPRRGEPESEKRSGYKLLE